MEVEPSTGHDAACGTEGPSRSRETIFPAELVVYAFPGGVGTGADEPRSLEEASSRTRTAIPPKLETKKVKGKNVEVTRAETSGHYHPAQFPGRRPSPIGTTHDCWGRSWSPMRSPMSSRWSAPTRR